MSQPIPGPLAVVTGASSGIGYELAALFAKAGHHLVVAANEPLRAAAKHFEDLGSPLVDWIVVDLSAVEDVQRLYDRIGGRKVDVLVANAGVGLGQPFLDQDFMRVVNMVDTNVLGTLKLLHLVGRDMRQRGEGRILVTGAVPGPVPGSPQAAYVGSAAFLQAFTAAFRDELKDTGVTVACLTPGPTDTRFFERAGMKDTPLAQAEKADPAAVARAAYDALMRGDAEAPLQP